MHEKDVGLECSKNSKGNKNVSLKIVTYMIWQKLENSDIYYDTAKEKNQYEIVK